MANDIRIVITGDPAGGVNAVRAVKNELGGLQSAAQSAGGSLKHVLESAAGFAVAQVAIGGLTAGWNAAKDSIIGFNSQMQNASISFTTLLGSADKAKAMLGDLQQFARTTPFEMPQLVSASQKLLAFGFNAKDIIPIMTAVGDATSAMGNVSAESLNRVTLAIGQIGTKGKVQTQELLQLTEAGIPAFQMLADGMGKTTGQIADMVEKGLIPADRGLKILLEGMENRAPGAMEKLSRTWTGATSNIKDSLNQLVGGAFKPFFDSLTDGANKFADFLMTDKVQRFASSVSVMLTDLSKGLGALFNGDQAGAEQWFGRFADAARDAAKQVELALLTIADAAAPAVAPIAEAFASLAANAVQWGANLITSFATGLVTAAGSILGFVLNDIMEFVAGFFPASPAKRGPFRAVYEMGAEMLNSIFKGMSNADFSALDTVMGAVKDVLAAAFSNGGGPKDGLIPALLGSEAGVAQALQDIHQFGSILDETMATLQEHLGDAAGEIATLITNVAALAQKNADLKAIDEELKGWARSLDDVNGRIRAVQREMDGVKRAFEQQRRPVEDQIAAITRLYDTQIRGIDTTIRKLEDQLRAQQALLKPQYDALDAEERAASLGDAQQRLTEAQNAAAARRAQLERDVADAQRAVANAQHTAAQPNQDPWSRQQNAQAVADAQYRLQQAQDRLNREGHQTDADRLAIARARRDVMDAQLAIDTAQTQADLTAAQADRAQAERDRTAALDPLQQRLADLKKDEQDRLQALQDQLAPLETERQGYEDMRDAAQARKQAIEDEKGPLEEAIGLVTTRLGHEKDVADQLQRQLDLLNQQAAAAAGGGGAHGGAGLAAGAGIKGGLGLNIPGFRKPGAGGVSREEQENAAPENIDSKLARLRAQVAAEFKNGVTEGLKAGFDDFSKQDAVWAGIGAVIGAKLGGPLGAAAGATFGVAFSKELTNLGITLAQPTHDMLDKIFGEYRFADNPSVLERWKMGLSDFFHDVFSLEKWKDFFNDIGEGIVGGIWDGLKFEWETKSNDIKNLWFTLIDGIKDLLGISSPSKVFAEIGRNIVQGVWDGITGLWEDFAGWVGDRWSDLVAAVKKFLGISSPSTVFAEIGRDLLRGLLAGVTELWTSVKQWFTDLPGAIVEAVGNVTETLLEKGRDLLTGLWNGVKALWETGDSVRSWFAGLGGRVFDAVGSVTQTLWQKGADMIQGFVDGMKHVWNSVAVPFINGAIALYNNTIGNIPGAPTIHPIGGQPKTTAASGNTWAKGANPDGGGGLLGPDKTPLPSGSGGSGWGGVAQPGIKAPAAAAVPQLGNDDAFLRWLSTQGDAAIQAAGYDPSSLHTYATTMGWGGGVPQLGNDDAFLRWLSTQSDTAVSAAGYDPAGLRKYATTMGWGGGAAGGGVPAGAAAGTATWAYPSATTQLGGGGGSEGGNAVQQTTNAFGVPGLMMSTVTEPGKTPLTTLTFRGQSWGWTGVPTIDDFMHMLGFTNPQAFGQWLAAIGQAGPWTGEGQGLFGSNVGDVQSLLDILAPNPTHHEHGGVTDGKLVLTGEGGPEVGELPAGTRIHSNTDSKSFIRRAAKALGLAGFADGGVVGGVGMGLPAPAQQGAESYTDNYGTHWTRVYLNGQWQWLSDAQLASLAAGSGAAPPLLAPQRLSASDQERGLRRPGEDAPAESSTRTATAGNGITQIAVYLTGATIFGIADLDKHIIQAVDTAIRSRI